MKKSVLARLEEHNDVVGLLINDVILQTKVEDLVLLIVEQLNSGSRLLFCGNGGSAADAQHLAAEFSGRFYLDRKALDAEALHVNSSYITAVGNDYSFEDIYSRALEAKGRKGDVLIAMSTSGESENIIRACVIAKEIGMSVIGFSGENECRLDKLSDISLKIPSKNTPRIQEGHMLIGHIVCELVEKKIFG